MIRRIYMVERDDMVPHLMKYCHLTHSEADKLFMMIVYGLFYVNRSMKWMKDDNWYEMQMTLNRFMFGRSVLAGTGASPVPKSQGR